MADITCDCHERIGIMINSVKLFEELKGFFENQTANGIFEDIEVEVPHYIGYDNKMNEYKWFADKWYRCTQCGVLWEFIYPDFPTRGEVIKHPKGEHPRKEKRTDD